jgi:RimJ/RimL family protein N-acetyltransferase
VTDFRNPLGQPIGEPVPDWTPRRLPPLTPVEGRLCRLEPLDAEQHAATLHAAYGESPDEGSWTYLPYGPFDSVEAFAEWIRRMDASDKETLYAAVPIETGLALGVIGYLRLFPAEGSIEIGHVHFAQRLQRTIAATEAVYLMLRRAFDELGYRRCEWKCDSLNAASRKAAERFGFRYEGTFRQAMVMKGRNRDSAWFSIIDKEWPRVRNAFELWLEPANFDTAGRQRERLTAWSPSVE